MRKHKPINPEFAEWYIIHCEGGAIAHFVLEVYSDGIGCDLPPDPFPGLLASYFKAKQDEGYLLDVVASDGAITYYLFPKDAPAGLKQDVYDCFLHILLDDMGVIL